MNEDDFKYLFSYACKIWSLRTNIFERGYSEDNKEELEKIEDSYIKIIQKLNEFAKLHIKFIEISCFDNVKAKRDVAIHLAILTDLFSQSSIIKAILDEDDAYKIIWHICRMLNFVSLQKVEYILKKIISLNKQYLLPPVFDVISKRGLNKFSYNILLSLEKHKLQPEDVYALDAIGYMGISKAEPIILSFLSQANYKTDEFLCDKAGRTLLLLGNEKGLEYFRFWIAQEIFASIDICSVIGKFGLIDDIDFLLERLNLTKSLRWKIELIKALGFFGSIKSVPILISLLSHENNEIVECSDLALLMITGAEHSIEIEYLSDELISFWKQWWQSNKNSLSASIRYRDGKPFDIRVYIDQLQSSDPSIRTGAFKSLIIYTGQHISFNTDGFLIHQNKSIELWEAWLDEHSNDVPTGTWLLGGRQ